jgi:hypothetical protein
MDMVNRIRKYLIKIIVQMLCATSLVCCLTPLDFEVENIGGRLVVSGQISPLEDRSIIQLGLTADTKRLPVPVSGATITLQDDVGTILSYSERDDKPGSYERTGGGIPGRTYHITIGYNGKTYESIPEKMPEKVGRDSLYYKFAEQTFVDYEGTVLTHQFLQGYSKSILPETTEHLYLRWSMEEVYIIVPTDFPDPFGSVPPSCFVTQQVDPQRVNLFNGSEVRTNVISEQLLFSRILDQSFHTRHYFTVYQSSLSPEAFEYWRKANIVANQVGSIFDTPPAEITGNVRNVDDASEKVYGYFQAVNESYKRFFLVAADLPYLLNAYCEYSAERDFRTYPVECLNCLHPANSSYRRPDWF